MAMENIINIGKRRELLWDEFLIDTGKTTAKFKKHSLTPKDIVLNHDEPWEGDGCNYHSIIKEDGFYRMYYLGWKTKNPNVKTKNETGIVVCYANSCNGISWYKPKLGLCEYDGSKENNIILDHTHARFDNFFVFKDSNPYCPKTELYKGIGLDNNDRYLWCFTSENGINFHKSHRMSNKGTFDTLNVAFWDTNAGEYVCYIRDYHSKKGKVVKGTDWSGIRDIRRMTSKDFKEWSIPVRIDFGYDDDYELYTNAIQQYYRADHMYLGFPSRYVEKKQWTPNFDQLPGVQRRKDRMKMNPRYGLTVTDCLFMTSRDGKKWNITEEAFMSPGIESEYNWVYGDCYPAVGMIETQSDIPYAPNEISMFVFDYHWSGLPAKLRRYTIRIDGFSSYNSLFRPCSLVTKPFVYQGKQLSINFKTSAAGFLKIKIIGKTGFIESHDIFGDSIDRNVIFKEAVPDLLSGEPVVMEITMSDADLYSFKFT